MNNDIIKWLESPEGEKWSREFHEPPRYSFGELATIVPLDMSSNRATTIYIHHELLADASL